MTCDRVRVVVGGRTVVVVPLRVVESCGAGVGCVVVDPPVWPRAWLSDDPSSDVIEVGSVLVRLPEYVKAASPPNPTVAIVPATAVAVVIRETRAIARSRCLVRLRRDSGPLGTPVLMNTSWRRSLGGYCGIAARRRGNQLAPAVGLEPTTKRLTAARSTTELRRSASSLTWRSGEPRDYRAAPSDLAPTP